MIHTIEARRNFRFIFCLFFMSPTDVLKQSNLGIEYSEMFPSKLASILSHAEFEWVDNASEIY